MEKIPTVSYRNFRPYFCSATYITIPINSEYIITYSPSKECIGTCNSQDFKNTIWKTLGVDSEAS